MKHDILTVMWKERKYLLKPRGSRARGAMVVGIPAVMALLLPLQLSEGLMETPFSFALAFIVALMVVGMTIPDSIAGERERHTLETLLASRRNIMQSSRNSNHKGKTLRYKRRGMRPFWLHLL